MKKQFSTGFIGYRKRQVDRRLEDLTRDYEEELGKKKDRMLELAEENHRLRQEVEEQNQRIEKFIEQEKYISRTLIKAEQRAQVIVEEGRMKSLEEIEQLKAEKEKWRDKFREVRSELLVLEQALTEIMGKFRDEINYYTAKEISESILTDEEETGKEEQTESRNERKDNRTELKESRNEIKSNRMELKENRNELAENRNERKEKSKKVIA